MFWIKLSLSALIIACVSELGKRYSLIASVLASLPLLSILALTWLYIETRDAQKVIQLSNGIFWAILPSLVFFLIFPLLLKNNLNFYLALLFSSVAMFLSYTAYMILMRKFGIEF